jgi:hypothetical protein
MTEIVEPGVLDHKPRRKLKIKTSDIIIFAVMAVVIGVLAVTLIGKLQLKHDVASAHTVTDKVITDIAKRDGAAARKLGSPKFQSSYSAEQLTTQFKNIEIVTGGKATVDHETLSKGKTGRTVFIIYKYPPHLANQSYFVRVAASPNDKGKWQLTNISGTADEASLRVIN